MRQAQPGTVGKAVKILCEDVRNICGTWVFL